jgi:hypothetical protein
MTVITHSKDVLRINAPEWYADPDWMRWLNSPGSATWHHKGDGKAAGESSDAFCTYCYREGSDYPPYSDWPGIPDHIWEQITKVVTDLHGADAELLVWVSNLPE